MVQIFDYLDYRKYLKEYYVERKKEDSHFSHRYIASRLDFDSGYFAKITKAERHISMKLVPKFIALLKLSKKEAGYFESLVLFCKAKTHDEKNRHFEDLMSHKKTEKNVLTDNQYRLFEKWYYLVIREILAFYNFTGDYSELARIVQPVIKPLDAKKAIRVLENLGLIKKNKDNSYERIAPIWTTGTEIKTLALVNLHRAMMDLAKDAFDRFKCREINKLVFLIRRNSVIPF